MIAGAKVEAANVETGVKLNSVTNKSGDFVFPLLVPGPYTLKVESAGFKTLTRSGIDGARQRPGGDQPRP